jgi:ssRNA-specific RNase YbeY (16S rRNA maturation enzyme)
MKVNICGLPHEVVDMDDNFIAGAIHFGEIEYAECRIKINKNMSEQSKKETLCHEMVHGILVHLGYNDYSQDEQFVQALGNAIYQGFEVKIND